MINKSEKAHHKDCEVLDFVSPDYFRPPSPAETPVNKVTAFYPPQSFVGVFERTSPGKNWIRTE